MPRPIESTTERTKAGDLERRRREWDSGCRKDAKLKGSFSLVWRYERRNGNVPGGGFTTKDTEEDTEEESERKSCGARVKR
jgi:hypothetical protein